MKQQDYYEILGVRRGATAEEILQAYRERIQKFHPDLHTGDSKAATELLSEKTKAINEAYATLQDPEQRKTYDEQFLSPSENQEEIETATGETETDETATYETPTRPSSKELPPLLRTFLFPFKVFLRPVLTLGSSVIAAFLAFLGAFLTLNIFFIAFRALLFLFQAAVLLVVLGLEVFLLLYFLQIFLYSCLLYLFGAGARWASATPKKHFAYLPLVLFAFYFLNRFVAIFSHFPAALKTLHGLPGSGVLIHLTLPGTFLPSFVPTFFGFFSVLANRPFYLDPSKLANLVGGLGAGLLLGVLCFGKRKEGWGLLPATALALTALLLVALLPSFTGRGASNLQKNELVGVWQAPVQAGKQPYDGQLVITEDNLLLVNDPIYPTFWFPCCYRLRPSAPKAPVEFTIGGKNSIELAVFPLSLLPHVTNFLWGKNIKIIENKGVIQSLSIGGKPYVKLKNNSE